jgi:hypothetical protein
MGLLDDAIREHLDLKRRRGADPTDVERAEREALGPVRRVQAPESAEVDEAPDQGEPHDDVAFEHDVDGGSEVALDDGVQAAPSVAYDHAEDAAAGVAFDHEAGDESWSFEDEEPAPADEPRPDREAPPEAGHVGQETAVHRPDFLDEDAFDEPDFESPRRDTPPPHAAGGETVEYDVEHALGSHPSHTEDGEELLEETPEFLQDTPDHDRLWFEQRPPKDFDFDG